MLRLRNRCLEAALGAHAASWWRAFSCAQFQAAEPGNQHFTHTQLEMRNLLMAVNPHVDFNDSELDWIVEEVSAQDEA